MDKTRAPISSINPLRPVVVRIFPRVTRACEGEGLATCHGEGVGLLGLWVECLPLVEAIGGDETEATLEGNPPHHQDRSDE